MPVYQPRFPIYIPSKSRATIATTPKVLEALGADYRIVVEEQQFDAYAAEYEPSKLLVLDRTFQDEYDTFDGDPDPNRSKGPGPARNFIWQHAVDAGAEWHWVMDDNITLFARLHRNQRIPVGDPSILHAMETFCLRYENVGMAGPDYWMFAPSRVKAKPYTLNRRIFSCNLIRNDVRLRWRGRYNEDLDLSIRMLKAGWVTVRFKAFLQYKVTTQKLGGGNTEAFYAKEGTLRKSQMAVDMHPEMVRLVERWHRWHHDADFSCFDDLRLIPKDPPPKEGFDYSAKLVRRERPPFDNLR